MGKYSGARACMDRLDRNRGRDLLRMCHTELPVAVNPAVWREPMMRLGSCDEKPTFEGELSKLLADYYLTALGLRSQIYPLQKKI